MARMPHFKATVLEIGAPFDKKNGRKQFELVPFVYIKETQEKKVAERGKR